MKPADNTHEDVGAVIRATAARVEAPASLRAEVDRLTAGRQRRRAPRIRAGFAFAGAAAAALAVALVLALGGSSTGGPSLADAAVAALQPTSGPAPAPASSGPVLDTSIDGIAFPLWDRRFNLRATGARDDKLHGRRAVTVGYAGPGGQRVGYTILATPPVDVPDSAHTLRSRGTEYAVWRRAGATVVTWRRAGHTCVLASRNMPAGRLLRLAQWTGGGAVGGYAR